MNRAIFILATGVLCTATAFGQSCYIQCMERSGCWAGGSVSDPQRCNNMPELCRIECGGGNENAWGAIAYSRRDHKAGWSYEQPSKASAESVAMRSCIKEGGAKCQVETSFNHLCAGLAADGEIVGWGTAGNKQDAAQRAMYECGHAGGKKCAVEQWVCSAPNSAPTGNRTPAPPPAPKAVAWGAIAYSSQDMGAGYSQGKPDRATAEREAMAICAQRGRACVLQTAFNKQCGALAADRNFTGWAVSNDMREALQKATDECRKRGGTNCAPHVAFCSM